MYGRLEFLDEALERGYAAPIGLIENSPMSPVSVVFFSILWMEEGADTSDLLSAYALIMLVTGLVGVFLLLPTELTDISERGMMWHREV